MKYENLRLRTKDYIELMLCNLKEKNNYKAFTYCLDLIDTCAKYEELSISEWWKKYFADDGIPEEYMEEFYKYKNDISILKLLMCDLDNYMFAGGYSYDTQEGLKFDHNINNIMYKVLRVVSSSYNDITFEFINEFFPVVNKTNNNELFNQIIELLKTQDTINIQSE